MTRSHVRNTQRIHTRHLLGERTTRRRAVSTGLLLALGCIVLASVLAACGGGSSDSAAAEPIERVGLMHVGTDHIPPSLGALISQLDEKYGWKVTEAQVDRCVKNLAKRCDFKGPKIELMWRNLEPEQAEGQAKEFVRDRVDVIVAFEDQSIRAAQDATAKPENRIPIVFLHPSDPVRDGLVKSLARPGGNLTGVFGPRDVVAKQLELYQLLVPRLHRVLTLIDPEDPTSGRLLAQYDLAASQLPRRVKLDIKEASTARDLQRIFRSLRPGEVDGAFLLSSILRLNYSALTIELASRAGIPVQAHRKEWVEDGALFSYGADLAPIGRAGARYVDSILRGTAPAKLPVEEVPTVDFAINLRVANKLGIKVPQDMSIRADEVYR
jgi:putative tryptophan/tyrosine transport system substrate-binding protein